MSAKDPILVSGADEQAGRPTDVVVSQTPPLEYLKEAMTGVGQVIGEAVVGVGDAVAARVSHMSLGVGGAVSSVSSGEYTERTARIWFYVIHVEERHIVLTSYIRQ